MEPALKEWGGGDGLDRAKADRTRNRGSAGGKKEDSQRHLGRAFVLWFSAAVCRLFSFLLSLGGAIAQPPGIPQVCLTTNPLSGHVRAAHATDNYQRCG